MTLPELKPLPTQEQVDALKAQVNCLRLALREIQPAYLHDIEKVVEALEATSDQCLSEVQSKAWQEGYNNALSRYVGKNPYIKR